MVKVRPRAHCAKARHIGEYELAMGTLQRERVGALMLTCGCGSHGSAVQTVYLAYDMPASTAHCDQITTSSPNSILDKLTFNLRRTLRAHVLIIQIPNLLLLRRTQRRRIRRPCILPDNVQIRITRWRSRWRRRGAWSSTHPALLSLCLRISN
jgi:hypothetical protein